MTHPKTNDCHKSPQTLSAASVWYHTPSQHKIPASNSRDINAQSASRSGSVSAFCGIAPTVSPHRLRSNEKERATGFPAARQVTRARDSRGRVLRHASGAASCVHHRRSRSRGRLKAPERAFGIPNNCSVLFWPTSQGFCGLTKLPLTWRQRPDAASGLRNFISAVIANGLAQRSPRSSLKSCAGILRATSKSCRADSFVSSFATKDGAEPSIRTPSDPGAVPGASTMNALAGRSCCALATRGYDQQGAFLMGANQARRRPDGRSCTRTWPTSSAETHNCEQRQRSRRSTPRGVSEAALAGRVATEARYLFCAA